MKNTKRIIAFLLTVVLAVSMFVVPTAADSKDAQSEEKVVRMYIAHKGRYHNLSGHTWVYFENLSNKTLTVGAYQLAPKKGVSVGTYGYSIANGRGLYYNVEAYRYNAVQTTEYPCLSKDLTQQELDKVSKSIRNSGTWSYLINCAFFACKIWNIKVGQPVLYLIFPPLAQVGILIYPDHGDGFQMYKPKLNEVYKQIGRGDDATLIPADPVVPK